MKGMGGSSFVYPTVGGDAVVTLRRNMRSLRMRVEPGTGTLLISAPPGVAPDELDGFVGRFEDWILESQARARLAVADQLRTGGRARLWGKWIELVVADGVRAAASVQQGRIHITRPAGDGEAARLALQRLHRRELARVAAPLLREWSATMGTPYPERVQYKDMRTRWGSCTPSTRRMSLNIRLAEQDPEDVEYVVVHELAHMLHSGHGPAFRRLLDLHLPDWRARQAGLKMHP